MKARTTMNMIHQQMMNAVQKSTVGKFTVLHDAYDFTMEFKNETVHMRNVLENLVDLNKIKCFYFGNDAHIVRVS